ncbi:alpha/beta hydrolase [Nocardioides sp. NPDC101246]|uniref:alpha/beta hydrolase n=1 Tax=Nocardioides sp. NPDC101246 TaxID=3364336 RepID=UPI003822B568
MTITSEASSASGWDEPPGGTPRGTLILLTGRGETAATYQRFGRRISADAYKVRLVEADLDDVTTARAEIEQHLADAALPAPKVLVGSDTGATLAATLVDQVAADAAVIAGIVLPESAAIDGWEEEIEARSACPVHRNVIGQDGAFGRGTLASGLGGEWSELTLPVPDKPVLVVHGDADPVTAAEQVTKAYADAPGVRRRLVAGGRHDILNDLSHRSVAATIILFLESLKLGSDLPAIVYAADEPTRSDAS